MAKTKTKTKSDNVTYVALVVDKSGSMLDYGLKDEALNFFNNEIDNFKQISEN